MINDLLLLSGKDIPFIEGSVTIHPPTIGEIALIGEEAFYSGCELLKFSKDILTAEDILRLSQYTDFDILMSIMSDKSGSLTQNVSCAQMVLNLIFPLYTVICTPSGIICMITKDGAEEVAGGITSQNFDAFKQIIKQIFCLERASSENDYIPEGELAKKIAEKFKKRKQQLAELKPSQKVAILSRYISILTVGEQKDMNSFMNYTVYQLFDEFQRFELKEAYDMNIKARLAGATKINEPEDWRKDLHDGSNNKK